MDIDPQLIRQVVEEVVKRQLSGESSQIERVQVAIGQYGIFREIDDAVAAADEAFSKWKEVSLEKRKECIDAMRSMALEHARDLAEYAHVETGLGRAEDKVKKNILQIQKTPGPEDIEPRVFTGDKGMSLVERAPFGVIGSITPTTNPVATIINNSISMLSGGNVVVFNPHPRAKGCCARIIQLLNQAIIGAGGPENCITAIAEPTMQSSTRLMEHPKVRCLVVTGGPGVVKLAMTSGKKAIAAGPGNPPVIVDATADIVLAGKNTVLGSSFDNNIMCTCEKEVFCVSEVYDDYLRSLEAAGGFRLTSRQFDNLCEVILKRPAVGETKLKVNGDLVGQNASVIAKTIGLDVPEHTRLLFAEADFEHPLVHKEQMMPVLPVVKASNVRQAIDWGLKAEGECYHTAVMHSRCVENLSLMAKASNANIFVKNGPNFSGLGFGGEGHTTMTIAGSTGEGITSARTFTRERRCALIESFRII